MTASPYFWDKIADKYAKDPIKNMPAYEKTLELTAGHIKGREDVLELGCGTGMTAVQLAPHVKSYTGSDISKEMVRIGKERAAEKGYQNISFIQAVPLDHDPAEKTFNAVLAFNLLHLLEELPSQLKHIHALTKPDGIFISKTPCLGDYGFYVRLLVPMMQIFRKAPYVSFFSMNELEKEIKNAGFEILDANCYLTKDPSRYIVAKRI